MHRGICVLRKIMYSSSDLNRSIRRLHRNKSMKSWLHIERHCEFSELIIFTYEHVLTGWIIQALICPMCMPACAGTLFGFVRLRLPRHVRDASFSKCSFSRRQSRYLLKCGQSVQQAPCFQEYESACQAPWQPVASMRQSAWCVCVCVCVCVCGCFSLWLEQGWGVEWVADVQMCIGDWDAATAS